MTRAARPRQPARRPPQRLKLGTLENRLRYGLTAVCVFLVVVGLRLVQLQGIDLPNYSAAADEQRMDTVPLHALRGTITDRNGTKLAYTSDAQDITADPSQVPPAKRPAYATRLSPLIDIPQDRIVRALGQPGTYVLLARALPPIKADKVDALSLPGIYLQSTTERQYPGRTVASPILGTVHSDGSGAAGIEQRFNSVLAGHDGSVTYAKDHVGNVNPSSETVTDPARNGATIKLTIDQELQYITQQMLDRDVKLTRAKGGQVVVLDATTAQVLAMASNGSFDAADPDTIDQGRPLNPAVMTAFEPGSVQKAITFAAAIQEGIITPDSTLNVPDHIYMGGKRIGDAWAHPTQRYTARGVLAQSSNVGTLKIAKRIGPARWMDYEQKFGIGHETGIELPGESAGYLPPMNRWSDSTFANLPFGQGESMTVLQLASVYQTLANGGVRVPPRIVQSVTHADGSVDATAQPEGIRVVSAPTARIVNTMLESVTMPGGTGPSASVAGYRVAGKTGTAQKPTGPGGTYSNWDYWDTFAGMIPADDPQFVVAIMIDSPAGGLHGGDVAAPLFHDLASYEVRHASIPPTGAQPKHRPLMDCKHTDVPVWMQANVC